MTNGAASGPPGAAARAQLGPSVPSPHRWLGSGWPPGFTGLGAVTAQVEGTIPPCRACKGAEDTFLGSSTAEWERGTKKERSQR